jgi:toxin-antitoxin system PIN domain toxin
LIAVDTNVLVYAHVSKLPKHQAARARLTELAEGAARWAIPVFCIGEFLRVITHPRLFAAPMTPIEACGAIKRLRQSPSLLVICPGERYTPLLEQAVEESGAVGNLVFDAQIVAVCRECGVRTLLTEDRDFARFSEFHTTRL